MANNSRQSRMSNKDEEFTFSWKLFTEWDFMIGSHDTAATKHASIITTFKESILEEKVKAREGNKWLQLTLRILANVIIVLLLALSTYVIQLFVQRSRVTEVHKRNDPNYSPGFWDENELTVIMTLISTIFPNVLDLISLMEKYHPRTSLRLMLARIFVLNLLNTYTLFIALYNKQNDLLDYLKVLESNATYQSNCTNLMPNLTFLGYLDPTSSDTASLILGDDGPQSSQVSLYEFSDRLGENATVVCVNETLMPPNAKELCWETMIGQEVFKLTVMDTIFVVGQIILIDVARSYFIKYCNTLCCWDLEKSFPEYPEFKVAENLLHLISNQGVIWLGAFFAPALPILNVFKLLLLVYVRCWSVMVFNAPQDRIFRASRSNNFYYALLLIMLFLCMLPPLFAIVVIEPSPQCGPFSGHSRIYYVLTLTMEEQLPAKVNSVIEYAASPGVILPLFMLLGMTIYYLISLGRSLKDANNELRMQLEYERTEGRRKVYAMADSRQHSKEAAANNNKGKGWKAAKTRLIPPGAEGGGKAKGVAGAATSLLQAVRATKALSDTKHRARNGHAGKTTDASKKSAQKLLERLKAAKKAPDIPVAVIKGKQSIKANGPAARER